MSKLKEIIGSRALSPGGEFNLGKHLSGHGLGGPSTGADSWFSRYSQQVAVPEEDVEEEEMDDIILEYRIFKNNKFSLVETLDNIEIISEVEEIESKTDKLHAIGSSVAYGKEKVVDRRLAKFLKNPAAKKTATELAKDGIYATEKEAMKALALSEKEALKAGVGSIQPSFLQKIPFLGKLAGTAIPVVDIAVGITFLLSSCKQINNFNLKFNKQLNLEIGSELPNYLVDAKDREFEELIDYIKIVLQQNPKLKDALADDFNNILGTIKDLIMTVLVAAQPYVTSLLGSEVPILGNIVAYVGGKYVGIATALAVHAIPMERFYLKLLLNFQKVY
jgi:hypothetical protein